MASIDSRNILVVAVVGRRTHLTPLLEIGRALHGWGHRITLAGMEGQLYDLPDFVQGTYTVCRPMDPVKDAEIHLKVGEAVSTSHAGRKVLASTLMFFDSFYPEIHQKLKPIVAQRTGPAAFDFILADFLEIAAVDLALAFNIPYATCSSQLSFPLGRASFVPGLPGLQQDILTNENATLRQRIYEWWVAALLLVDMLPWFKARMALRAANTQIKDRAHLHFVNSFWGFETPRAVHPLIVPVGPLIRDTWSPLTSEVSEFLSDRSSVVYVAFGTLAALTPTRFAKLLNTLHALLSEGRIDGAIWSVKKIPESASSGEHDSKINGNILLSPWVPQRAVLAHESTKLFISHAGSASVFEAMYHGVPTLCVPHHGDQNANALRCELNGVGFRLDKHRFTAEEATQKAVLLLEDKDGRFGSNSLRMQRIVTLRASIGPQEAAVKIQEVLFDHEASLIEPGGLEMSRPPHLEMPSARMGFWKSSK
ncbi:hypothetical protein QTJ16_004522 [Diplocarpon rosae]|uniref:Glycosyltransferase n=1 Tax=Diplocarpon rosae TaxID=946125 RepID=A0AAD9SZ38_9HELO|nr:hypothetical protein QTJ16_004522 [Diplocarpon rosae]